MFDVLNVEISGASHEPEMTMRMSGLPAGLPVDMVQWQAFCDRRKSGCYSFSTPRTEPDVIELIEGIENGMTTDGPITAKVRNRDARPDDYAALSTRPRPSHADYACFLKYGRILPGGGPFSGRMTLPLCMAGGLAVQWLEREGVQIAAYVGAIGGVSGASYKTQLPAYEDVRRIQKENPPVFGEAVRMEMLRRLMQAAECGDSLGGVVECMVYGLPSGTGGALWNGLEGRLAYAALAIPSAKGVEFGDGFSLAEMTGSAANDAWELKDGAVQSKTHHNGGLYGGTACGGPVAFRTAFKPVPSIAVKQQTVDLASMEACTIEVKGRHDTCVVPRAVVCVEAAAALALCDAMLSERRSKGHAP